MFRIVKRTNVSQTQRLAIRSFSVLLALVTSALFIYLLGQNPLSVYQALLAGSFGTKYRLTQTIIKTIPLLLTSLGILIAFKMKFWNIGAEGQIMMGAFAASYFALHFDFPMIIMIPVMILAGAIGGGLWALIPAYLKTKFNTNETIITLMMNYVALQWITYLQYALWKDPKAIGFPKIAKFSDQAILPNLLGVHAGWLLALVLLVITYIFLKYSKMGYEIAVIGESHNTARYAGISVKRITLWALFISGAFSGLTGMIQASAVNRTLTVGVSGGVGFTAIITAWLSGLNVIILPFICFFFASLVQGASFIQSAFQIPASAAQILQSIILFFVLGSEFFINYQVLRRLKGKEEGAKS